MKKLLIMGVASLACCLIWSGAAGAGSGKCGNGKINVDIGEQCDGALLGGQSCESLGFSGGVLACSQDCRFSTAGCTSVEPPSGACAPDSVQVGPTCVDTYEASVWEIAPTNTALIQQVRQGTVTLADLTSGGAIQRGVTAADYPCADTGNDCKDKIFAVSIPGVKPASFITWFQAEQACANAGKGLLTNQQWQRAAAGTPDTGTDDAPNNCNVFNTFASVNTGSRSSCVSAWGAFDMVGNLHEWVADWRPVSETCTPPLFGTSDDNCLAGASLSSGPGAIFRGGSYTDGADAGVFTGLAGL